MPTTVRSSDKIEQEMFQYSCGSPVDRVAFEHPSATSDYSGVRCYAEKNGVDKIVYTEIGDTPLDELPNQIAFRIVELWHKHGIISTRPSKPTEVGENLCTVK